MIVTTENMFEEMVKKYPTSKFDAGMKVMEGFQNQGLDQQPMVDFYLDKYSKADLTEDALVMIAYCYKKVADFETTLEKNFEVKSKYSEPYVKFVTAEMDLYIKDVKNKEKIRGNVTVVVRCICLTRILVMRELLNKHKRKLGSSFALPFFLTLGES